MKTSIGWIREGDTDVLHPFLDMADKLPVDGVQTLARDMGRIESVAEYAAGCGSRFAHDLIQELALQRQLLLDACELVEKHLTRTRPTYNGEASLSDTGDWDEELEYIRHALGRVRGEP